MLKIAVFWDVISCSLVDTDVFEEPAAKVYGAVEGDNRLC